MQREAPPYVWAAPDEKNILNCEYTLLIVHGSVADHAMSYRALHHCTLDLPFL